MRAWLPWLLPVGMVLVLMLAALTPPWVPGIVLVVVIVGVVPRIWRVYSREHPDRQLPPWLPGGRPPR